MTAKYSPDTHFVGTIKLVVRAHCRSAAVDLLKQRLAVGQSSDLGEVVDYGFVRSGPMNERTQFEHKEIPPDYFFLLEQTRKDEQNWPDNDEDSRVPMLIETLDDYETEFDNL